MTDNTDENTVAPKTGWPAPELAQDNDRKLFRWFASRLDARRRVREAATAIRQLGKESSNG